MLLSILVTSSHQLCGSEGSILLSIFPTQMPVSQLVLSTGKKNRNVAYSPGQTPTDEKTEARVSLPKVIEPGRGGAGTQT